jgi:hypothetical protein
LPSAEADARAANRGSRRGVDDPASDDGCSRALIARLRSRNVNLCRGAGARGAKHRGCGRYKKSATNPHSITGYLDTGNSRMVGGHDRRYTVAVKRRRLRAAILLTAAAALLAVDMSAQPRFRRGGRIRYEVRQATPDSFDGSFNFCRAWVQSNRYGDGGGWLVDYPRADINLSIRISELTKTRISTDGAGQPNHLVVRLTDDELFQCPFVMMTEVGSVYFDDGEAARLREYLTKGGFLWADDFWGEYAWQAWEQEFRKVLPAAEYPIVDLPLSHPMFRSLFEVKRVPQIPSINHWVRWGMTSERGADSAEPHARAVLDKKGRLMVLMTHNTDVGDSWEREGDDPDYFYNFSVDGYAFGINVLVYAMTH